MWEVGMHVDKLTELATTGRGLVKERQEIGEVGVRNKRLEISEPFHVYSFTIHDCRFTNRRYTIDELKTNRYYLV